MDKVILTDFTLWVKHLPRVYTEQTDLHPNSLIEAAVYAHRAAIIPNKT